MKGWMTLKTVKLFIIVFYLTQQKQKKHMYLYRLPAKFYWYICVCFFFHLFSCESILISKINSEFSFNNKIWTPKSNHKIWDKTIFISLFRLSYILCLWDRAEFWSHFQLDRALVFYILEENKHLTFNWIPCQTEMLLYYEIHAYQTFIQFYTSIIAA